MHVNMVQPSPRALETRHPRAGNNSRARQTRNNNGQVRARGLQFRGNDANKSTPLLDDLRINTESTTYGQEKRKASTVEESMACKIWLEPCNSYEIYINARPLSRPLEAFCRLDDPEHWLAAESHSQGIVGGLEAIPEIALNARRRPPRLVRRCWNGNSNRINRAKRSAL